MTTKDAALAAMDAALGDWTEARDGSARDDLSDLNDGTLSQLVTTLCYAIERFAPPGSQYLKRVSEITDKYCPGAYECAHEPLYGVLKSLRDAYQKGYLTTIAELVHADVFNDFLQMAEHLLNQRYKDPSAVLVGGTLEEHLRKLCTKHAIPIADANGRPRKASTMNDELAKVAYDTLQQKEVACWLDLRNSAAHGKYAEYDEKSVHRMLDSVRDFLTRFRA